MAQKYWIPQRLDIEQEIDEREKSPGWFNWDWRGPTGEGIPILQPLLTGLEQFITTSGAQITSPFRPMPEMTPPQNVGDVLRQFSPLSFYPGGAQYQEYERWKAAGEDPSIPVGIPSGRQLEAYLGMREPLPEYEQARWGMAETAEFIPWMLMGVGGKAAEAGKSLGWGKGIVPSYTGKTQKEASALLEVQAGRTAAQKEAYEEALSTVVPKVTATVRPPISTTSLSKAPQAQIPRVTLTEPMATNEQKFLAHQLAQTKGIKLFPKGKAPKGSVYSKLAYNATGKRSMTEMTELEANLFIEAIWGATIRRGKVVIPKGVQLIPEKLMEKFSLLHEIGGKERFRQMPYVIRKIGLYDEIWQGIQEAEVALIGERAAFNKTLSQLAKSTVGRNKTSRQRIFDALDDPMTTHLLDDSEQQAFKFFKKFFDDWANRLKLPASQRRKNYITHIFEEAIKRDIKANHPLDPELLAAMEFSYPKQVFNPYLLQRLGGNIGLKRDPFAAAQAYEQYALRQYYYNPQVKKLAAYLPIVRDKAGVNAYNQVKALMNRMSGRPDLYDKEVNFTIKEFAESLPKWMPAKDKLVALSQTGNPNALFAHQYASLMYQSFLGIRPISAIRNLSQQLLAASETSPLSLAKGVSMRFTNEGKRAVNLSLVLRSRQEAFIAGVEQSQLASIPKELQKWSLAMFKGADKENVKNSFLAGYAEARSRGLSIDWAIKRGDEVAMKTQYLYTKMARSLFEDSAYGRWLTPFTSWPRNFMELQASWIKGDISNVYKDYMAQTGKKVFSENPIARRKALMTYFAILTGAFTLQSNSDIKALEYTGFTSYRNLGQMLGGDIPSLQFIGGIGKIVGGTMGKDERMVKEGLNDVRPDRFIGIIRQLENIAKGKSDWIDLFIYMEAQKKTTTPTRPSVRRTPSTGSVPPSASGETRPSVRRKR